MKRGIALLGLGGPDTLQDVKPFLYNLFLDPDIFINTPAWKRRCMAYLISRLKARSSRHAYSLIGGGSPQLKWTQTQARALEARLGGDVMVEVGMRAWKPTIGDALERLRAWGADEVTLFPLFPHFSRTMSGSCLKEADRVLAEMQWAPSTTRIQRWPDQPGYIALIKKIIHAELDALHAAAAPEPLHIVFSAHSMPMKIIESGDPYLEDVQTTIGALSRDLSMPWTLAFQSRNGPIPWLKPYLEDEIKRLAATGVKTLLVVPVSFTCDHIETLYELDLVYADLARATGITHYRRTRSFNDDPEFIEVLASLATGIRTG